MGLAEVRAELGRLLLAPSAPNPVGPPFVVAGFLQTAVLGTALDSHDALSQLPGNCLSGYKPRAAQRAQIDGFCIPRSRVIFCDVPVRSVSTEACKFCALLLRKRKATAIFTSVQPWSTLAEL